MQDKKEEVSLGADLTDETSEFAKTESHNDRLRSGICLSYYQDYN